MPNHWDVDSSGCSSSLSCHSWDDPSGGYNSSYLHVQMKKEREIHMYTYLYVYILYMFEGSLEVKLPTIWTDEKQSRAEAERRERLEERRVEERRCRCAKR